MSINNFEINFIKFLQECEKFNLTLGEEKFLKTSNSLKRNIQNINSYLPLDKKFLLNGNIVTSQINYRYFLEFLKNLDLKDYFPSKEERINFLIINNFFKTVLNKSELYNSINISLTTLKKDTQDLKELLKNKNLVMVTSPKKGVEIQGDELQYRIFCTTLLLEMTDLESNGIISSRKSNTPLEKALVNATLENISPLISQGNFLINSLLENLNCKLSYGSKKFLTLYLSLSLYRIKIGYPIKNLNPLPLDSIATTTLESNIENKAFNTLFSSLDFTSKNFIFFNEKLDILNKKLIESIQENIITEIQFKKELSSEIYNFLYKNILRCNLNYSFYDDKLENTDKFFKNLFKISEKNLNIVEDSFNLKFSSSQIAIFTLILKRFITKSKIAGRNRKRIIIISNSSQEKLDFFVERLKLYVEADVIGYFSIDELDKIETLDFDLGLTFSNRIKLLLEDKEIKVIKTSFYLESSHIETLLSLGFSRTNRKILAKELSERIHKKTSKEIEEILKNSFPEYFV